MSKGRILAKLGLAGAVTAAVMFAATPAQAQEEAGVNNGAVSFALGADVVTQYYFRGIEQEDSGLILQPYAEASFEITDDISYYLGTWQSLHSKQTGSTGGADIWYESDFYTGVSLGMFDPIGLDVSYVGYYAPNGAFDSIHELDFVVSYDDSELMGDYAFGPYALLAIEIDDEGGSEDIYLELGGELAFNIVDSEDYPVDLSIPVYVGLSLDDYYTDAGGDNEFFGYGAIGASLGVPLPFIPEDYGSWSASAGLTALFLNDDANLNDTGDDLELIGSVGISMEY